MSATLTCRHVQLLISLFSHCRTCCAGFVESFNISVAAALIMYEAQRQRIRKLGSSADLTQEQQQQLLAAFLLRGVVSAGPMGVNLLLGLGVPWEQQQAVTSAAAGAGALRGCTALSFLCMLNSWQPTYRCFPGAQGRVLVLQQLPACSSRSHTASRACVQQGAQCRWWGRCCDEWHTCSH
jgi:hypothetical protein